MNPPAGSVFMVGFEGTHLGPELRRLLEQDHAAGVILFERNLKNPAQVAGLVNEIQQAAADRPVLIAVDQEGGRVARLKSPFTQWPSARRVGDHFGKTRSVRDAYAMGEAIAHELSAVGINMDLAPVLDVQTNPGNAVIGDRAFSTRAQVVCDLGLAFMAGLQDSRVVACGKHFPGHGDTAEDSHERMPVLRHPPDRLRGIELVPFVHLIENGLKTVMTAHVLVPSLDPEFPATLSGKILHDLLRKELGFQGTVVTDDLMMKAIADHWPPGQAAIRALTAGADLLLVCRGDEAVRSAMDELGAAIEKGEVPRQRFDEARRRIDDLRKKFLPAWKAADPKAAAKQVGTPGHKKLSRDLSRAA